MNECHKMHPALRAAALTGAFALTLAGCKSKTADTAAVDAGDPAAANMAQPYSGGNSGGYTDGQSNGQTKVMGQSESYNPQSSGQNYESQSPAPIIRQAPAGSSNTQYYPVPQAQNAQYTDGAQSGGYGPNYNYNDAEEAGEQALAETNQAPPPLPEYDQPPAPQDNDLWTPGYWNYANTGYYWVPGVWCAPPFYGALWTPPYWGYSSNHYLFHRGYWGSHVGYYGGVNYGFGYIGTGYFGGYWNNHNFYYNRAVTNVNINNIHNVYDHTVVYDNHTYGPHPDNRVSYNGGRGGLTYQPRPQEIAAMHEAHYAPVAAQRDNRIAAAGNRSQFFAANGGHPAQAFGVRPLGNTAAIPTAPREQAFNHPIANNPAFNNNRPGTPNPALNNRPGAPNQPGFNNNRPGEPNAAANNRPGTPTQPAFNNNRPGTPNQPALANRPGESTRPNSPGQPGNAGNRPGEPGNTARPGFQPNQPNNARPNPGVERNTQANPAVNRPQPAANQPTPAFNHSQPTPNQSSPAYNRSQPTPTQPSTARPTFQSRPTQPQAQPAPRPNVEVQRPAPQVQQHSAPAARPAAPASRPAPAPAPHAAPAEAPHGGGGGDKPHNH